MTSGHADDTLVPVALPVFKPSVHTAVATTSVLHIDLLSGRLLNAFSKV